MGSEHNNICIDKTRNIYETSLDPYNKLMHDGSEGTISQIDDELKHISNNLGIADRIEQMKKCEALILFPSKTMKKISKTTQNVD